MKGTIYVTIEGDEVKGKVSFPLDKLNIGMVRGRYLNGEADLKASLKDGVLIVTLDSIEVNGKKPPEEFLQGLRQQNLAKDMYKDEKNAAMIRKFESLEIKDGKITIKVRAKPGDSKAAPDAKHDSKEVPIKIVPSPTEPKKERPLLKLPSPRPSFSHPRGSSGAEILNRVNRHSGGEPLPDPVRDLVRRQGSPSGIAHGSLECTTSACPLGDPHRFLFF